MRSNIFFLVLYSPPPPPPPPPPPTEREPKNLEVFMMSMNKEMEIMGLKLINMVEERFESDYPCIVLVNLLASDITRWVCVCVLGWVGNGVCWGLMHVCVNAVSQQQYFHFS